MTSPTFHVSDAAGEPIVATGGVLPALITTESVWDAARAVRDAEADGHVARRVGPRWAGRGRVVVRAIAVEIPGVAQGVARVGVAGTGGVEVDGERRRPVRRAGAGDGRRRLVPVEVANAPDRAAVEVDVEQLALGRDLDVDRVGRGCDEVGDGGRVGEAVGAREHDPDAVARVVGEEQRAVVRGGIRAAGVEGEAGDRRAADGTGLARNDLGACGRSEERQCDRAGLRVQRLRRCSGPPRRSPAGERCLRSTATRSSRRRHRSESTTRLISSKMSHPTSPTQTSLVPGRIVNRNGLRRPWATIRRALGSALPARGLSGRPAPVSGSTRSTAPLRAVGSPECAGPDCGALRPGRSAA